jgi:hypothetical protein
MELLYLFNGMGLEEGFIVVLFDGLKFFEAFFGVDDLYF